MSLPQSSNTSNSVPPGSSLALCRSCDNYFGSVNAFDTHRSFGNCEIEGTSMYRHDGVWDTMEGHQRREAASIKMEKARQARTAGEKKARKARGSGS